MNKGLEVIEAHHLFGVPYERIDVVVHPQSIVHSLIELNDGAQLAHLGLPDMRVPISYALHFPERADVAVPRLDLAAARQARASRSPTSRRFACLRLAREAGEAGGTAPCVAQRRRRGRGRGLPRGPDPVHRDRRGDRGRRSTRTDVAADRPLRAAVRMRRRARARSPSGWSRQAPGRRHELGPRLRRLRVPDHPPRGGALRRGEGRRHAGRALLPLLPAEAVERQARRDRVRDRRDPARRLREDHRHEPRGGARPRGRTAGLLPPAGLEADRRDRAPARSSTS